MIAPVLTTSGGGAWGVSGTRAAGSGPKDKFTRAEVPPSLQVADLRALAASRISSKPSAKVDINKIRFGVEIEMEHFNKDEAAPTIQRLPAWDKHPQFQRWEVVKDASLTNGGEAKSPVMTLEGGEAARQIATVVGQFKALGGRSTQNCAFQVHIDATVLGEQGLANLTKMALEQEHLLFKLAQNGQPVHRGAIPGAGFRHNTPYWYTRPLCPYLPDPFPILHATTSNEFRNAIYTAIPDWTPELRPNGVGNRPALPDVHSKEFHPQHRDPVRYFGINFNSYWYRGTVEFRVFNGTDDPDQIMSNIELVLGMVKAAAEGDYAYLQPHPLNTANPNQPVSKESYNYFMSKVAPSPKLQEKLKQTFLAGGGQIEEDRPITDPHVLNAAFLMEEGYKFKGDGKEIASPLEVASELSKRGQRTITVADPSGSKESPLQQAGDLEKLIGELEASQNFSEEDKKRLQSAINDLRGKGFTFVYAPPEGRTSGTDSSLMQISRDAQIMGAIHRKRLMAVPPGATQEAMLVPDLEYLERYARVECSPTCTDVKAEEQEALTLAGDLQQSGHRLVATSQSSGSHPLPLVSRNAILDALRQGSLQFPLSDRPGDYRAVRTVDDMRQLSAIALGKTDKLDDATQSNLRLLQQLETKGVRWTFDQPERSKEDPRPMLNRVGQIEKLANGTLVGVLPHRKIWDLGWRENAKVPNAERLRALANKHDID